MASRILVFLLLLPVSTYSVPITDSDNVHNKITGGKDAQPHEFPWMAMITDSYGIQECGASLISDKFVLTAGHCLLGIPSAKYMQIRLGVHNQTSYREHQVIYRGVKTVHMHPNYTMIYHRDFTLLELDLPVRFNEAVQPICLPPLMDFTGEKAIVTGWGFTSSKGKPSDILQKVEIPVWNQNDCIEVYKEQHQKVTEDMLCAGEPGKDACQLDSGGPLIWKDEKNKWYQIGIVSWGDICGSIEYPGVYARVTYALEWIKSVVNDVKDCN